MNSIEPARLDEIAAANPAFRFTRSRVLTRGTLGDGFEQIYVQRRGTPKLATYNYYGEHLPGDPRDWLTKFQEDIISGKFKQPC